MHRIRQAVLVVAAVVLILSAKTANAQWVMVARAVSGQIQQMSHKGQNGSGGYDVATVMLEANADKVYSTALASLKAHEGIKVTKSDAKKRLIEFTNGTQYASLQAMPFADKLSQLIIASTLNDAQPDATSLVLQGVLKVCKEMNVKCTAGEG
ncbi:MAG: hypothetical protein JOZ83_08185 [Silvibacterium sp.]|nr:hypothetical protein [Silvibacterium sp.]